MKDAVEFTDFREFKLVAIDGPVEGLSERIIFKSPDGDLARILEFAPGTDTSPNGVQVHDYREELFIIEGSVTDLTLGETFTEGMVASRPPGMKHGPWKTESGCVMYEIRYFKN
ncbi:cupin [Planomicrobium sp. Y74]|uniref:cupin n=1 Tax=Planomicrobium sp. Y74 TaxID=2478977 RepID=UPI000EF4C1FF|nr:cupin [Planomicrobium sp. Y74]RLQ90153.1 cupin [Planomicrobium sp. Y74]